MFDGFDQMTNRTIVNVVDEQTLHESTDISHMTHGLRPSGPFSLIDQHFILSENAIKPFLGSKSGLLTPGETVSALRCVPHRFLNERRQSAVEVKERGDGVEGEALVTLQR
jgi:hypothetical protein